MDNSRLVVALDRKMLSTIDQNKLEFFNEIEALLNKSGIILNGKISIFKDFESLSDRQNMPILPEEIVVFQNNKLSTKFDYIRGRYPGPMNVGYEVLLPVFIYKHYLPTVRFQMIPIDDPDAADEWCVIRPPSDGESFGKSYFLTDGEFFLNYYQDKYNRNKKDFLKIREAFKEEIKKYDLSLYGNKMFTIAGEDELAVKLNNFANAMSFLDSEFNEYFDAKNAERMLK